MVTIQMAKWYAHLAPAYNQAAVDRLPAFRPASEAEPLPAEPSATGPEMTEVVQLAVVQ